MADSNYLVFHPDDVTIIKDPKTGRIVGYRVDFEHQVREEVRRYEQDLRELAREDS